MLLRRNLLETLTITSCTGTALCIFLNCVTSISPITGIWFLTYILFMFISSVICSFKFMQWLLHLNKPIKYDVEGILSKYPFLAGVLPQVAKKVEKGQSKEYDTNELSIITTVLEKRLVSSWYVTYISEEIGFPFACKQMLDQMISKAFQICDKIETKDVYVDICAILLSHLKEYKKAIKRHETNPEAKLESLYKKIHPISENNIKNNISADHCINLLRIVLKELVPWELWDTPYSELLVRILAKKLNIFIENTISNPIWLNDRLLTILNVPENNIDGNEEEKTGTKENAEKKNKEKTGITEQESIDKKNIAGKVSTQQEKDTVISNTAEKKETNIEPPIKTMKTPSLPKATESPVHMQRIVEEQDVKKQDVEDIASETEPVEIKPILRKNRGRQGRNEVKIYDRIIEGSVKTWETDMDLQCISVGQDLLASLDEMTLSRLWGHEDAEHSPSLRGTSPQPLWFGEEDAIELDVEVPREARKEHREPKELSPKPGELLKDLQSTVSQAKAKIGDLQDEAAGMMEGLLDKGIAGLKKGLRFTGLGDDTQLAAFKEKGGEKISPSELFRSKPKPEVDMEAKEAYISTNMKDDNSIPIHPLVKQQRVTSQDSMHSKPRVEWSPPAEPLAESPEPQYEEAADLSASIAKLRSLLQHVERPSGREEVWWEGAEETRGRAQRRPSSKPVDTAALADEYDMNLERNASPGQTTNNMQRLDKLFTRTVTGVFNSLRTAVGAEGAEDEHPAPRPLRDWTYVCTSPELSLGAAVGRLVGARRASWQVDTALDSLRDLPAPPPPPLVPLDLEEWCSGAGARWCGSCELASAAGLASSHLAFRLATILTADVSESLICAWLEELTAWLKEQVFAHFQQLAQPLPHAERTLRRFDVHHTSRLVVENMPGELHTRSRCLRTSSSWLSRCRTRRGLCAASTCTTRADSWWRTCQKRICSVSRHFWKPSSWSCRASATPTSTRT
ncbi:uncharacterized protein LOC112055071 isoform X2 [Bicyclus anynana]|uniref:Uncharacterized protein LOC112055071 isoform X2 n=1 Tax=Bicyclus anynana TaxID=110368 RepID=A0ABM3LZQ9_BICAN|nr:uncharacterized protein LOC112055071 isoform X2 [Bicyclus anynana]